MDTNRFATDSPWPGLRNQPEIVRMLDNIGAAALWLRDVPLYDPGFGDVGQVFDPLVYAGWLAALTRRIAIGTAGIVLPLRDPIITAKQAASTDQLLNGRFLTGLASGDRDKEYPAVGSDYANRADRYREALGVLRSVLRDDFPRFQTTYYGDFDGGLDLIPKPAQGLPLLAIGRAGQSLDWLAGNVDGWIWHGLDARRMAAIVPRWRELTSDPGFKPYGYGTLFDLDSDADAPLETSGRVLQGGRHALTEFLAHQREAGVNHVILNLKPTRRAALEVLEEMGKYVIPEFRVAGR